MNEKMNGWIFMDEKKKWILINELKMNGWIFMNEQKTANEFSWMNKKIN